jgi:AraC-like DNA-binding protein
MENVIRVSKPKASVAESDFILLSVLQNAIRYLQMMGLPRDALLRGTQFSPALALTSKNSTDVVRHSELLTVFTNAIALAQDPAIGLRYGLRAGIGVYGMLGYAMVSAPTDLHAVNIALKYQRLLLGSLVKVGLSIDNAMAVITFDDCIGEEKLRRFYIEQLLASCLEFNKAMTGQPAVLRALELAYPAPDYAQTYQDMFNCPVRFNAKQHRICFDCGILSVVLPNADPLVFEACERICAQTIQRVESGKSVTARTRELMIGHWPALPSMEAIAAKLGIDVRTLRRKLLEEGNSFRSVKDSIRRNIAIEYLQQTQMSIEEVSTALGFSDAVGFRRAFRRWTGKYPRYYRQ